MDDKKPKRSARNSAKAPKSRDSPAEEVADDAPAATSSKPRRKSKRVSDQQAVQRRRSGHMTGPSETDGDVEQLPDRFDSRGRPLHEEVTERNNPTTTTRRGEFERPAQARGQWNVSGSWEISGTNGESVDRISRSVTGALEGRVSWWGLLGDVGRGLLGGGGGGGQSQQQQQQQGRERVEDGGQGTGQRRR